jgi:rubrerythrin
LDHINSIEPESIKFAKEEEDNNKLAVLDLEMNVNRKKKKVEFGVHYKESNTNITIKKKSNHKESIKKGVIKGYAERARALCDPEYLSDELQNIEQVFEDNGYTKEEIRNAMKETEKSKTEEDKELTRGIVVMQNIPGVTPQFNKIARKHGFRVANKTENRVKDLISNAKTPLGDKNTNAVYNIPCKCQEYGYTGETDRKWGTRKKEHQDKVRLTKEDIRMGKIEHATKRMNDGDGGLARHASSCSHDIDWEHAKIVGKERGWSQRKYLEGIETLRQKNEGKIPLNSYNQLEQWQSVLYPFFEKRQ